MHDTIHGVDKLICVDIHLWSCSRPEAIIDVTIFLKGAHKADSYFEVCI